MAISWPRRFSRAGAASSRPAAQTAQMHAPEPAPSARQRRRTDHPTAEAAQRTPVLAPPPPRPIRLGVALGGGMARGWAHLGALRALDELGLSPHVVAGTSIGAVAGAAYCCGRLETLEDWVLSLKTFTFWRQLRLRAIDGLFSSAKLGELMQDRLGHRNIEELDIPFGCIASDLGTGQEVWLRSGSMVDAVRASYAIPGFFSPVEIEGHWLADGALVNPVPVTLARALGADLVIAISLSGELLPGAWQRSKRRGQPTLFGSLATAFHMMQHRLNRARLAGDPPDVQVSVACQHIGLMDFHRGAELMELGEKAVRYAAPRIEAALELMSTGRLVEEHIAG